MKKLNKWLKLSVAIALLFAFMLTATSCATTAQAEAKDDNGKFDDIEWTYDADDKELVINGEGAISSFEVADVPWKAAKISIETIKISSGITEIGDNAFAFCSKLTSVSIPSTVTSIGDSAFEACIALDAIEIPAGVTELGERVFAHCSALEEVIILGNVSHFESWAFKGCKSLETLTVYCPEGETVTAADDAFLECAIDGIEDSGVELKTTNTTAVDITVKYVYEDGTEAAATYTTTKNKGESYEVASPEIEGYEPDKSTVSGTVANLLSIEETVTYKPVEADTEDTAEVGGAESEGADEDKPVNAGTIITIVVFAVVIIALIVFAIFMFRPDKKVANKNNKNNKK
ncbi:MAG: leucine-rich repeat protein [Clostridia bacterium]|nr:leucine-rich repeat protein [Clostridia bacterium]